MLNTESPGFSRWDQSLEERLMSNVNSLRGIADTLKNPPKVKQEKSSLLGWLKKKLPWFKKRKKKDLEIYPLF
jgi:hypothetical protein